MQLTFLVCAVELSVLVRFLSIDAPPAAIAIALAAFHSGYLSADILKRAPLSLLLLVSATSVAALALVASNLSPSFGTLVVISVILLIFNCCAQGARRLLKPSSHSHSAAKNTAKATGMIVGGVLGGVGFLTWLLPTIAACVVVAVASAAAKAHSMVNSNAGATRDGGRNPVLLWAELLHHAHYFCYVYTFWYLGPSLISPFTGVWFVAGWLAYFVAENLWRERRHDFLPAVMAAAHLVIAILLFAMPHLPPIGVLIAWFATGIGGGTAYMLGNARSQGGRERYEDLGHVVGTLVAAATAAIAGGTPRQDASVTLCAAASLACAAAAAFWLAARTHSLAGYERSAS